MFMFAPSAGSLPGTKSEQTQSWLFWSVCFGPLLFPVSLVVWHAVSISRGEEKFNQFETLARSRVLNSLSVLTKSALQLTLQATILMVTWRWDNLPYHATQLCSVAISTVIIAKSCADHHYFDTSGKNVRGKVFANNLFMIVIINSE